MRGRQRLMGLAKDRLLHGFRDNTWFLQTKGTDYDSGAARLEEGGGGENDLSPRPMALPCPNPTRRTISTTPTLDDGPQFTPDRPVTYPFKDITSLESEIAK